MIPDTLQEEISFVQDLHFLLLCCIEGRKHYREVTSSVVENVSILEYLYCHIRHKFEVQTFSSEGHTIGKNDWTVKYQL